MSPRAQLVDNSIRSRVDFGRIYLAPALWGRSWKRVARRSKVKVIRSTLTLTSICPASRWMHWATYQRHSCLSRATDCLTVLDTPTDWFLPDEQCHSNNGGRFSSTFYIAFGTRKKCLSFRDTIYVRRPLRRTLYMHALLECWFRRHRFLATELQLTWSQSSLAVNCLLLRQHWLPLQFVSSSLRRFNVWTTIIIPKWDIHATVVQNGRTVMKKCASIPTTTYIVIENRKLIRPMYRQQWILVYLTQQLCI